MYSNFLRCFSLCSCSFGSFFGPSQPVIAQRVIQESKSLLENPDLAAKVIRNNNAVCICFSVYLKLKLDTLYLDLS